MAWHSVPTPRKSGNLKILCFSESRPSGFSVGDDFAVGLAHRHAVAVGRPHHDALHHRLPADEGFLAAFQDGHHLSVQEKPEKSA